TVGLACPALLGIVALGMSGYCTVPQAIAYSLGSTVVWQVLMFMLIAGGVNACGLGEYIARWIISRPFLKGRPVLFVFMFFMGFFVASIMTISIGVILLAWNVVQNMADIVGYDKKSSFVKAMTIFTAMACGLGEFCVPFKGWQLALCEAYTAAVGSPMNYPLFIFSALLLGIVITFLCTLAMKYVFKHDFSKLAGFDSSVLASGQSRLNFVQKIYLFAFVLIMVVTLISCAFPPELPLVKAINTVTTAGIYAIIVGALCLIKVKGKPLMDFAQVSQIGVRWEPILICAAAIPIANALTSDKTGILDLFSSILSPMFANAGISVLIIFILIVTLILTNLGSNTGVALFLIAITVPLGLQMGANMGILGIVIIYSASLGLMFPGASALSALLYGQEGLDAKMIVSHTGVACLLYVLLGIPYFCLLNVIF
ncbi:MAG: hypothetical protein EOM52_05190, partial [Clostridia bacterium]|nr:hypothetical protein [Clostridia bacterium]